MVKFLLKKFLVPIILAGLAFVLFSQDQFLYTEPVGQIIAIKNQSKPSQRDEFNNYDQTINQSLSIRLLNSSQTLIQVDNQASRSQTNSQIYRVGQQVLLTQSNHHFQIKSLKRDASLAAMTCLVLSFLIIFLKWRDSFYLILSLLLSFVYFLLAIYLNLTFRSLPSVLIYTSLATAFSFSSLTFVLGLNRQMVYTFLTTLLSTGLTFLISLGILNLTHAKGLHFEYMDFVTKNPETLFFMATSISVLGAVMDCCGDIVAGLFALSRQKPETSQKSYFHSGLDIGREITGTLTNVLFMIFIAGTLPMTFLLLRNGNSWSYVLTMALNLGLLQTLISAIGIILSVPISASLTSYLLSRNTRRVQ